ncbi:PaaI family thioesterase [Mycobacterium sp. ITM-2016-00317]|uniref:PaaI family thioesterase n=1 Tax=Mycobacterium sp. ITM-2016-00317 TaxID=2099694 RepID=UPI000D404BFF|nr:PaaI family thioesterase [Mycobacterium sp. ITM-2016-00317]WNG87381.1 PaaI family thioesterase [Mycobacterium sp. ITM-2016-00317]
MPYPLNTPLGRFGVQTAEESPERCVASIPVAGLVNPLTGAPTTAPLAMLVDHVGGLINHARRGSREWTVSSELSLEVAPEATEVIATATVRSFYITVPDSLVDWPDQPAGTLPGTRLDQLMAVQVGESGGAATILVQNDDPVLNNSVGAVHGGVSSMGLELAANAAVNHRGGAVVEHGFRTASLRVNFLRPFHGGGDAHYRADATHTGRSSAVAEARAVGRDGRTAITARLTAYR